MTIPTMSNEGVLTPSLISVQQITPLLFVQRCHPYQLAANNPRTMLTKF